MQLAGQGGWIHANCAMWSAEVYENKMDNSYQLLNVHVAISRGNVCTCTFCGKNGATVGCVRNHRRTLRSEFPANCARMFAGEGWMQEQLPLHLRAESQGALHSLQEGLLLLAQALRILRLTCPDDG